MGFAAMGLSARRRAIATLASATWAERVGCASAASSCVAAAKVARARSPWRPDRRNRRRRRARMSHNTRASSRCSAHREAGKSVRAPYGSPAGPSALRMRLRRPFPASALDRLVAHPESVFESWPESSPRCGRVHSRSRPRIVRRLTPSLTSKEPATQLRPGPESTFFVLRFGTDSDRPGDELAAATLDRFSNVRAVAQLNFVASPNYPLRTTCTSAVRTAPMNSVSSSKLSRLTVVHPEWDQFAIEFCRGSVQSMTVLRDGHIVAGSRAYDEPVSICHRR
jgi:hypothetical protein